MKKVICVAVALMMCAALAGCAASPAGRSNVVSQEKTVSDILEEAEKDAVQQATDELNELPLGDGLPQEFTIPVEDGAYDIDLTTLSSTMVYSEVYGMMMSPEAYVGKTVKMNGAFAVYEGENRNYYACLIADATACCSQGIEFVLDGDYAYPNDYPALGTDITVAGTFDTYYEEDVLYCQLIDAKML